MASPLQTLQLCLLLKIRLAIAIGTNCISGKLLINYSNMSSYFCIFMTDRQTDRPTDRQTDRQTDKQISDTSKRPHCLMHMAYCNIAVPVGISDITTSVVTCIKI